MVVILPPFFCPATFVIEAPFGRFATAKVSIFTVDGIRFWMRMELVSLILFVNSYLRSPLSPTSTLALTSPTGIFPNAPSLSVSHPPTILAAQHSSRPCAHLARAHTLPLHIAPLGRVHRRVFQRWSMAPS